MKKKRIWLSFILLCVSLYLAYMYVPPVLAAWNDKGQEITQVCRVDVTVAKKEQTQTQDATCATVQEAGEALRSAMVARVTNFCIRLPLNTQTADGNACAKEIFGIAITHTGEGKEGDYLKWQCVAYSCTVTKTADAVAYDYYISYLTDARQEAAVEEAVKELKTKLSVSQAADVYTRFLSIYDYVCRVSTYAEEEQDINHTAYGAIIKKTAVCQGYATLLYRLLLEYGIDNRIVVSREHAWNLVCIDGMYYECDATWDSQRVHKGQGYQYACKADLQHVDSYHTWLREELDDAIYALPRSVEDYVYTGATVASRDIAEIATVILVSPTMYAEWENGTALVKGYYQTLPAVTVLAPSVDAALLPYRPLVKNIDYTVTVTTKNLTTYVKIAGMGNCKGTISIAVPSGLQAPAVTLTRSNKTVKLKWKTVKYAESYVIYRKKGNTGWKKLGTTKNLYYVDKKVAKGSYTYRVKACRGSLASSYSSVKRAKIS